MNWELLLVIGVYCILLWNLLVISVTFRSFMKLNPIQQQLAEVNLGYNILGFVASLVGLLVYHFG